MGCFLLLAAFLVPAALAGGPNAGYLPMVGPAPLRFQVAPRLPLPALPPLANTATNLALGSAASRATNPAVSAASSVSVSSNGVGSASSPAPGDNLAVATNFLPVPSADTNSAPLISPQALVHFFTPRPGFSPEPSTTVPVSFSPAAPPAVPSSTATYVSQPKP